MALDPDIIPWLVSGLIMAQYKVIISTVWKSS